MTNGRTTPATTVAPAPIAAPFRTRPLVNSFTVLQLIIGLARAKQIMAVLPDMMQVNEDTSPY